MNFPWCIITLRPHSKHFWRVISSPLAFVFTELPFCAFHLMSHKIVVFPSQLKFVFQGKL